jgi:iron complex outermembrane receptor protein
MKTPSPLSPVSRAVGVSLAGMLGCGITHAHAHAETPAETALPTVVVTANGGGGTAEDGYRTRQSGIAGFSDQDLLDTPLSVKVLPAQLLANLKIDTIAGIDRLDASVGSSAANPGWFSSPTIRGFTLDNSSNFRYNGMTMINQQATALENKERVEILKGPSALQAGFSAPGGIIHYVTKRPGLADTTQLHLSASQYGNYKAHADVSRRSADGRYGLRLNAAVEDERSYVHGVDGKRSFLSLAADVRIAPGTQLQLDMEHEKRQQNGQPYLERANGRLPEGFNPRTFLGQEWARYPTEFNLFSGKLEHTLNDTWTLAVDASWMKLQRDQNQIWSVDGLKPSGDGDVFLYYSPDQEREPASIRFSANGAFQTGAVAHKLAVGVQAQDFKSRFGSGFWGQIGSTNIHNPVAVADPRMRVAASGLAEHTKERGVFFNDAIGLGDAWTVHLGGRYADREQRSFNTNSGVQTRSYNKSVFTPSAALVYKPAASVSTYASYIEGLESGGEAPAGTSNAGTQMAPLVSKQWETGVKADLGRGLTAEAAVFRIEKPAEFTRTNGDGSRTYVQNGLRRHQGLELSLIGKLAPEWTLFASAMLLDAKLQKTNVAATEGKRPPDTARQRLAMTAEYSPSVLAGWSFIGNWTHTGEREVVAENTGEAAPGYHLLGLGARYQGTLAGTPATWRVNLDNALDKRFWAYASTYVNAGAPRTLSASLALRF